MAESESDCGCGGKSTPSADGHTASTVAAHALQIALSLPDDVTAAKNFPAPEAAFLTAVRNFAAACSKADSWTTAQRDAYGHALTLTDAAVALMPTGGGGSGESCTARCNREKGECNDGCSSYFCFFDCRLTFLACLAGCIKHGATEGGGGSIA